MNSEDSKPPFQLDQTNFKPERELGLSTLTLVLSLTYGLIDLV